MKKRIILVMLFVCAAISAHAGFKMYGSSGQYVESCTYGEVSQASTKTKDYNKELLETYGMVLGRAAGCKMDTTAEFGNVKQWIADNYSGDEHTMATLDFVETFNNNFGAQLKGQTPDTCEAIQRVYPTVPWP